MEDKKIEETVDNQILTKEEIAEVESLENKKDDELTPEQKANKKLYARMKEYQTKLKDKEKLHEEELTKVKKELEDIKKSSDDKIKDIEKKEEVDPIALAKQVRKLSTLSDEEISYAQILAKGMGKFVEEVIDTNEFKVWSNAQKDEEKKKKTLDPDGRFKQETKKDEFFEKFSRDMPKGFEIK